MATDNCTTPPAAPALPNHGDLLNALIDIRGAVRLSHRAVSTAADLVGEHLPADEAGGTGNILTDADGALTLVETALQRLYDQIDAPALRQAWPTSTEEGAHG